MTTTVQAPLFNADLSVLALVEIPALVAEQIQKLPANWLRVHLVPATDENPGKFVLIEMGWVNRGPAIATMFTFDTPNRFEKLLPGRVSSWEDLSTDEQSDLLRGLPEVLADAVKKTCH